VLERLHDLLGRRVGEGDDLADATAPRIVERGDDVAKLERQTAEVARALLLVRRRDDDDGRATLCGTTGYRSVGGERRWRNFGDRSFPVAEGLR